MILYKLTDRRGRTRVGYSNETQWGPGVEHRAIGPEDGPLCSDSWIHAYIDPVVAVLMNPIHANVKDPMLWEAEGLIGKDEHALKVGCRALKTLRAIDAPVVSTTQRVAFAVLCAQQVGVADAAWSLWAADWLSGRDRSRASATRAAEAAGGAAAWAGAWAAACAAEAEATVGAIAWAAACAMPSVAARAAWAAAWAAATARVLDFAAIAHHAMKY